MSDEYNKQQDRSVFCSLGLGLLFVFFIRPLRVFRDAQFVSPFAWVLA